MIAERTQPSVKVGPRNLALTIFLTNKHGWRGMRVPDAQAEAKF